MAAGRKFAGAGNKREGARAEAYRHGRLDPLKLFWNLFDSDHSEK
jgi:hypothetical protein